MEIYTVSHLSDKVTPPTHTHTRTHPKGLAGIKMTVKDRRFRMLTNHQQML